MKKLNRDDINDLAVLITGNLVIEGLIPDCTDTDDETECEVQDVIVEALVERLTETGQYINLYSDGSEVDD
jgi:hypothetical protein